MALEKSLRQDYFPAIEKKYGESMKFWFEVMKSIKTDKYPDQINYLRENHGFSQVHANALVMYTRGSKSPQHFSTFSKYYKSITPLQGKTIKSMMEILQNRFPSLEWVLAWNQPMLRQGKKYVFGVSATKSYLLIAPGSTDAIEALRPKLTEYKVNKKTIQIPSNWEIDSKLLIAIVRRRIAEKVK